MNPASSQEESRTCAFVAIQTIHKYKIQIHDDESIARLINANQLPQHQYVDTSDEYVDQTYPNENDIPAFDPDLFKEVPLFNIALAENIGVCEKCKNKYNKGEPVARSKIGTTHFRCKTFFAEQKG